MFYRLFPAYFFGDLSDSASFEETTEWLCAMRDVYDEAKLPYPSITEKQAELIFEYIRNRFLVRRGVW